MPHPRGLDLGLAGQVAVVTGASGGIGQAVAVALSRQGAAVAALARNKEGLTQTVATAAGGAPVRAYACDLGTSEALAVAMEEVTHDLGPPTILVNNAGQRQSFATVGEIQEQAWRAAMDANLDWAFRLSRMLLPVMQRSGGGAILNIGSVAGERPIPRIAAYSAAKAALHALTRSIAREYAGEGIRANALAPGWIATPMNVELRTDPANREALESITAMIPMGRFGTVDEIAGIATVLVSPAASYLTGQVICVDGGLLS